MKEPVAAPKEEVTEKPSKPRVAAKKKASPTKVLEEKPLVDKSEEPKVSYLLFKEHTYYNNLHLF